MLFLIWGSKNQVRYVGEVSVICPSCHHVPCDLHVVRRKFTLYYIPLFTTATFWMLSCPHCQKKWQIDGATAARLSGTAAPRGTLQPEQAMISPPAPPMIPTHPTIVAGPPPAGTASSCGQCGAPIEPGTRFCHRCGASLPATPPPGEGQPCPVCGSPRTGSPFCGQCGTQLRSEERGERSEE